MGSDNATAALLLKGSLCAALSPSSCLRVVSHVGRQLGIEWVCVSGGVGWWSFRLAHAPQLGQFLLVAEGKRAGQLSVVPS